MSDPPDDLRYLLDDLSDTLDALRDELDDRDERDRRGRRGRRGAGRDRGRRDGNLAPPRPGRFLQFTEEYTIPTLISFLEANVRALELLQGLLGLLNGSEGTRADRRQFEALGGRTMDQLDGLLDDLQGTLEGRPTDPDARDLLEDARSLRREIDDRIAGRDPGGRREEDERDRRARRERRERRERGRRGRHDGGPVSIDVSDASERSGSDDADGREDPESPKDEVDVDAELDSIRREVHGEEDAGDRDEDGGTKRDE